MRASGWFQGRFQQRRVDQMCCVDEAGDVTWESYVVFPHGDVGDANG